jgi:galactose mutarotase-like enzyme
MSNQATLHTISNNGYKATIANLGAELKSLVNTSTSEEYIWPGEASVWKGSAPVLFPIVGRLKNGEYHHHGNHYQLPKHGFARNSLFELATDKKMRKVFYLNHHLKHFSNIHLNLSFKCFLA